jgi:hypothetical protein
LRRYGLIIDRGRLVREAIAILLADLDARGKDSLVARRVRAVVDTGIDAGIDTAVPELDGEDRAADQAASPLPSLPWRRVRAAL